MAKHNFRLTRIFIQHLLSAPLVLALVLGFCIAAGAAEPQSGGNPPTGPAGVKGPTGSARKPAQGSETDTSSASGVGAGKRDPFKLPQLGGGGKGPVGDSEILPGEVLPPGKRGLIISQLRLEGVVRQITSNKMTALVVDQRRLAYFLHDSDSVYNGVVSKITPDSIYFTENILDPKGHVTTREVVKRLGAAPGEGR